MRTLAKFFGYSGGIVVVIIAGQYAFMTSDNALSGAIWAFLYGFIALGGLFGPALAARVWRYNKAAAAFIWAVALASLAIAISNEVGAMAGRGSEQTAQRATVADTVQDTRRSLTLAESERAGLQFTPADGAAVQAAQAKATAATAAKTAECSQRGPKCREKEAAEALALADVATITGNKALTDRAAALDIQIAGLREKIEHAGPVRETNTQGKALARLFGLDDAEAARLLVRQNTAMMIVVELLIVALILAAEEIEKNEHPAPAPASLRAVVRREPEESEPGEAMEPEAIGAPETPEADLESAIVPQPLPAPRPVIVPTAANGVARMHVAAQRAKEAAEGATAPQPLRAASKPRLIASEAVPVGSVVQIVSSLLEPGTARSKLSVVELYRAYAAACAPAGKRPIAPVEFPAAIVRICEACSIAVRDEGKNGMFLMKVKIKSSGKKAATE